ncbi:gag-pol polyprotein [Tanacetum coccineum]
MEEAEASIASHSPSHRVAVSWHQKLGHMSEQGMKILMERKLIPSLTKAPAQSLGGAKYFVSFINDYSRRYWVYPIKKKSDVFEDFKVYKARVELDSGTKIKCLRTDNGGEYTGDEFDLFYRQGIKRARAMLATASLGKLFWAEVVNTACYVINRSPSTAVELKTPMEMGIACGTPLPTKLSSAEMLSLWKTKFKKMKKVNETTESQALTTRTSNREIKCPVWQSDFVMESNVVYCLLTDEGESSTLQEALNNPDASFWKEAMQEEIEALYKNKTWELVPLPGGRKPIGNKWVYKIKRNGDDQVEKYHARLVVKEYA